MSRKLVFLVGLILGMGFGVALAAWWAAGSLPDGFETGWAADGGVSAPRDETGQQRPDLDEPRPQRPTPGEPRQRGAGADDAHPDELRRQLAATGSVELDARQLRDFVVFALAETPDGREFLEAMRSPQASIEEPEIEVGGLIDLSRVDTEALSPEVRDAVETLRRYAPFLTDGERYVGLRGTPVAVGGELGLEGGTVRIGKLGVPLSLLMTLSGESSARQTPSVELEGFRVTRAEVVSEKLVVEARPS